MKVKLPNSNYFECNFGVNESISKLFEELDLILIDKNYYLFIPPFAQKKFTREMQDTFNELKLVPDVCFNLLFFEESLNKKESKILQ